MPHIPPDVSAHDLHTQGRSATGLPLSPQQWLFPNGPGRESHSVASSLPSVAHSSVLGCSHGVLTFESYRPVVCGAALGVSVLMLPCTSMRVLILGVESHERGAVFSSQPVWRHMVSVCSNMDVTLIP